MYMSVYENIFMNARLKGTKLLVLFKSPIGLLRTGLTHKGVGYSLQKKHSVFFIAARAYFEGTHPLASAAVSTLDNQRVTSVK